MTTITPARNARRPARRSALGGSLRVARRALTAAWVLLRVAVVVAAVAIAVAWRFYGYVPVAVQTGSMTPTYPVHTLLFVHDVRDTQVRVGDVITFDPPGRVPRTTHRVVAREQHGGRWYFRTKGDANPVADDWREPGTPEAAADETYLRGVSYSKGIAPRTAYSVPYLGWLAALGTMPYVRVGLLCIPFVVIALQLLSWIWRREDEDEPAGDEAETAAPASEPEPERVVPQREAA
ncbi:MAG: signal peptidase [Thermoleophilia bacterium]|nr:signal peptidase [Thermoleophilia bacterium]